MTDARQPGSGESVPTSLRRLPLNPCDCLYLAHHRLTESRAHGGNISFMVLDAEGRADPRRVRAAYAAALRAHPVILAPLRISLLGGRPYWKLSETPPGDLDLAVERGCTHDDLRHQPDWQDRLEHLCQTRNRTDWDLAEPPLIRIEHYDLPDDRTRFCFRFAHALLDAEGAQWFAAEMSRLQPPCDGAPHSSPGDLPSGLARDDRPIDVLGGVPILRRLRMARRAFAADSDTKHLRSSTLIKGPYPRGLHPRYLHKLWPPARVRQLRANAQRSAPPGPAHHARFLATCVIRALHRLHTERGLPADAYRIPFPVSVVAEASDNRTPPPRPVQGNYLVSATICGPRDLVHDKKALAIEILRQFENYRARAVHLDQWAVMWLASLLRTSMYKQLLRLPLGLDSLASGFSYLGWTGKRIGVLAGARITNFWGSAPMGMPPGWNPIFLKFAGNLNLVLSWLRPAVPDELAIRYADLIEEEVFDPD